MCLSATASAETLDRVVASVGNTAITASDVEEEYRFELFLKGKSPAPPPDAVTLDHVRDRLVEQKLLVQEAEAEETDHNGLEEGARQALGEVRRLYPNKEAYQAALRALGLTEQAALARLQDQVLTLRLIDQRLRPAAWADSADIETYYAKTFVPEFRRQSSGPVPPLEEVETQIREILIQRKIDQLLSGWLVELKAGRNVKIHSF